MVTLSCGKWQVPPSARRICFYLAAMKVTRRQVCLLITLNRPRPFITSTYYLELLLLYS